MDMPELRALLADCRFGQVLEHYACINSTNLCIADLARQGAPEGTLVLADSQTHGRGRQGRTWVDEPGTSLLFSLLLRPTFPVDLWPLISLAAAAAVARAIGDLTGIRAQTKWPNDVVLPLSSPGSGRRWGKVAGVLVESGEAAAPASCQPWAAPPVEPFVVVGIGINVLAAPALPTTSEVLPVACLADCLPRPPRPLALLPPILERFADLYASLERGAATPTVQACRQLDITIGQAVTLETAGRTLVGTVLDIEDTGALLLATSSGLHRALSGSLRLCREL